LTKKTDIPVRFRIKKCPRGHMVQARRGNRWKTVHETVSRKRAVDWLVDLWSEYLGVEM
jgi:hypothetical protein